MKQIFTLGEILVEIMATEKGQSFLAPGTLVGPYASGAPAIFIDQVAKLGCPAGMFGCVGDDDFGRLNINRLREDGVSVKEIQVIKQSVTGSAFVTYHKDGERDFIFNITNSASAQLLPSNVTEQALANCDHFHVMGSSLFSFRIIDAIKKAIDIVKAKGGTVSFDPNIRKEMLRIPEMREALTYILEFTDIFLPSGNEVSLLTDAVQEKEAIAELLNMGVKEVVIKRGAKGCTYFDAKSSYDAPAFKVEEIDPTGAGDCFGATYVACRHQGMDVKSSLRYANAAGALGVCKFGPMEGTSTFPQLDAFIAEQAKVL